MESTATGTPRRPRVVVPARAGRSVRVRRGERGRIVDLAGGQVGDLFAFAEPGDTSAGTPGNTPGSTPGGTLEWLSASHTRAAISRLFPAVGEAFVTDRRRPILTLAEDTSPGYHDLLIAACDDARYAALGATGHPSCARNLHQALAGFGLGTDVVPQPVNVFMHIPVSPGQTLIWLPAATNPGDSITFTTELDCVVVLSACPQDLTVINGAGPTDLAIDLLPAPEDLR